MNINCDQLDDLLFEGDPLSMATAARHAEGCETCLEKLAAWNEISDLAPTLHVEQQNDLLWPRIERALQQERRASRSSRFMAVAAALLVTVSIAAISWRAFDLQRKSRRYDEAILRVSAVDEADRAEERHAAAIANLEKLATPKLDEASTPLMVNYREKLMLLDDAIAECQTNIDHNRQNAHLRKQLLTMLSEKQRTLHEVLLEDPHASQR